MRALVDNDVLLKGSCYGLLPDLLDVVPGVNGRYGILGAARFVVPKRLERLRLARDTAKAQRAFAEFIHAVDVVEPTAAEQALAADLEASAQRLALNLDVGESQLAAILASRACPRLVTGDKRAVGALEQLLDVVTELGPAVGRVLSLEQCVVLLIKQRDAKAVCIEICREQWVDKALSICCSCSGGQAPHESIVSCLQSYIDELRSTSPRILAT